MIDVKLIRMMTGEEIITEIVSEDDSHVTIKNALVVIPQGQGVGFAPWASVIDMDKPEIKISRNFLIYIVDVNNQVRGKYNEIFGSKLTIPEEKRLIL